MTQSPVLPGENLVNEKTLKTEDLMIKYELKDLEKMQFIDPHIIQPTYQVEGLLYFKDCNSPSQLYMEGAKPMIIGNNIQMEQCIDLDVHLSPTLMNSASHTTDELNTPLFEVGKELHQLHVKNMEGNKNPFIFPVKLMPDDEGDTQTIMDNMIIKNSHLNSVVNNSDINNSSLLSPNNTFNVNSTIDINLDEYDLLSDYNDAIINDISSVINEDKSPVFNEINGEIDFNIETPEASTCSDDTHPTELRLDLNSAFSLPSKVIETPDVINTIDSIEKDFNIFGHLHEEISKVDAIKTEPPVDDSEVESCNNSTFSNIQQYNFHTASTSGDESYHIQQYKQNDDHDYNYEDDDDEDYVPPGKKAKSKRTKAKAESSQPAPRRGRPPKRMSVSSDNSESSKYREMRDKNNEASRRSRQKRKVQEIQWEQEKDDLELRNLRLKAQVEELEKSISSFRSSLIEIMLKK